MNLSNPGGKPQDESNKVHWMVSSPKQGKGGVGAKGVDALADSLAKMDQHICKNLFDDEASRRELLALFLLTIADRVVLANAALADGDWRELSRMAHLIRGASGHVGARQLSALAAQVELAAEARDLATARRHWQDLTTQFKGLQDEAKAAERK
jgi:HPt (histidine-containing phosphotransfer) domain-containing protein